ncbi:MAG: PASTA domain-containing protein [Candidatus Hydrogenedentes bacterium]|nr:PASTA domain-containing protein [Candidatus Hydrogenedentota bacterium]
MRWSVAVVIFLAVMAVAGYYVFNEAVAVDAANRIGVPVGKDLVVPDVQGFHKDTARLELEKSGLSYSESIAMNSAKIQRDYVMLQRPEPGSVVRAGRRVYVTLSLGQDSIAVPDVRGKTEAEARSIIDKTELSANPTVSRYTTTASAPGTVLSQYPMPGQVVSRSVQISLLVSEGQSNEVPRLLVPNLVGLTIEEAEDKLESLGLSVTKAMDTNPEAEFDVVLRQFPEEGKEIAKGGTVTVNVRMKEDTSSAGVPVDVAYTLPQGFGEREVTIKIMDVFGNARTVFQQRMKPGYRVTQPCKYTNTMTAEILLDGQLTRRIIFEEGKEPRVTEF